MKEILISIVALAIVFILLLTVKIADYNFCSKYFPNEKLSCTLSSKYRFDGK